MDERAVMVAEWTWAGVVVGQSISFGEVVCSNEKQNAARYINLQQRTWSTRLACFWLCLGMILGFRREGARGV